MRNVNKFLVIISLICFITISGIVFINKNNNKTMDATEIKQDKITKKEISKIKTDTSTNIEKYQSNVEDLFTKKINEINEYLKSKTIKDKSDSEAVNTILEQYNTKIKKISSNYSLKSTTMVNTYNKNISTMLDNSDVKTFIIKKQETYDTSFNNENSELTKNLESDLTQLFEELKTELSIYLN